MSHKVIAVCTPVYAWLHHAEHCLLPYMYVAAQLLLLRIVSTSHLCCIICTLSYPHNPFRFTSGLSPPKFSGARLFVFCRSRAHFVLPLPSSAWVAVEYFTLILLLHFTSPRNRALRVPAHPWLSASPPFYFNLKFLVGIRSLYIPVLE